MYVPYLLKLTYKDMKKDVEKKIMIEIDDKEYPCYVTMGAYVFWEKETGKDVRECTSLTDQITFLWACCKGACCREHIEFNYTLQDFANNITPDDMAAWQAVQPTPDNAVNEPEKKV